MIQKIFITYNGIPIIAKDYIKRISGKDLEEDLLSPYISAISNFAKQVQQDNIEAIVMGKSKLFYRELNGYPGTNILCVTDREDSNLEVNSKLNVLINTFINNYTNQEFIKWDGNNSFFDPFYLVLDDIVLGDAGKLGEDFKLRYIETMKLLKNNFDKIIRAVILGDPIIVVGEEKQIKSVINILEIFGHGKVLKTIYLSNEDQDADILGVTHKDFKYFDLRGGKMIVDLIKGKILGGSGASDLYCRTLIKDIKGLSYENALRLINSRLSVIYNKLNTILILSHSGDLNSQMIDLILKDIDKNAKNLIVALMRKLNVKLYELIEKYGSMEKNF
ncbi:MAG: hypothetical protein ACTSRG_03620 [Candidatus Helarchaeota archaeon]